MKRMIKRILFSLSMLFVSIGGISPITVHAADETEVVGFSVQANLPENQINEEYSYFDLLVEPGQKQSLEVVIYNQGSEEIEIQASVNNASTSSSGSVVYEEQEEIDSSLKVPLSDILTLEEDVVTVPAGESKTITAELAMPEEEYDGIILGGLNFEKVTEEDEATEGVNIQNKYAYVIGVQLSENDNEVSPELALTSVKPDLVNYRTAIIANIQNSTPVLIGDVSINAQVFKEDEDEPIKEKQQENISMAPNSTMNYAIDWGNDPLDSGNYTLKMTAKHQSKTWNWEEDFMIENNTASDLNENAVELNDNKVNKILFIGIIILTIAVVGLLIYIWKKRGKNKQE